jgi:hypothetical protein
VEKPYSEKNQPPSEGSAVTALLLDAERARLAGQCQRIMAFYRRYPGWYTLGEIVRGIGAASEAGVSMRLRELTYAPYGWVKEKRIRRGNLREYRLYPAGGQMGLGL